MSVVSLGVDVGGTFTDFVLLDEAQQRLRIGKRLTTPHDPSEAIIAGTAHLLAESQTDPGAVRRVVHGTTLVANTIIERKGAATGLLTTKGFRDTLEIGRELRYDLYDLFIERPEPLVPRYLRYEVDERVDQEGAVLRPLDEAQVLAAADALVAEGVQALAICFLHAYRNPAHERRTRDLIVARHPQLVLSLSSDVAPEIREYERTTTTVANAYVRPLMMRYLGRLEQQLQRLGMAAPLHMMLSSGGVTTADVGRDVPIQLIESGPAAGAIAAAYYGQLIGEPNVLSFDMGGTTAKICLVTQGRPAYASEFEAARVRRFKRGSGLLIKVPVIELIEIGAGGGSIARVDRMGLLKVGPQSAGADPGPACYGRGGCEPTVTDADLLLGHLDPGYFLGGEMPLDVAAARQAVEEHVARPLGLDSTGAALGVHDVVNEMMAAATRIYAAERGHDPRRYTLLAFGGAGPVHAYRLARLLKLRRVVCPLGAGATSALGFLVAPMAIDFVRSYVTRLEHLDWAHVRALYGEMEERARGVLAAAGVEAGAMTFERSAEMRYVGQGYEIAVPLAADALADESLDGLRTGFQRAYERLYERSLPDVPVQALTWRLVARGPAPQIDLRVAGGGAGAVRRGDVEMGRRGDRETRGQGDGAPGLPKKGERQVYVPEAGRFVAVPVYDRYGRRAGDTLAGPASVVERESTAVVGPECHA
ncbi:MAG: hydantoinase/oxoprolinase family protein, partial [Chloroflexi bacterium]|nr:hydantoinase/oxoprolinase family protein [Chloroflexota bacterium]